MADPTTTPYEQWTVRELRDELRARNLSTAGSQPELAARLTDAGRPPQDLTIAELKDQLREQDKPVSGTKDELVDRLTDDADTQGDPPTDRAGRRECVVDDGTVHMGRAVPGKKVCSAHEMHYRADGTRR